MGLTDVPIPRSSDAPAIVAGQREELVRRVAGSSTFEKSPRLRAFFLHVCQCALDRRPEAATEQQIGIHVYDRPPGYNPNEDNIVRSQARLLRMKLEHYFANEGRDEPIVITIPKGRYLPAFEERPEEGAVSRGVRAVEARSPRPLHIAIGIAVLFGLVIVWLGYQLFEVRSPGSTSSAVASGAPSRPEQSTAGLVPGTSEVRIVAGHSGTPIVDASGRSWDADRYFEGGVSKPGPKSLFPPAADPTLFKSIREGGSEPPPIFRYDIPLKPGAYEMRLYFADPIRRPDAEELQAPQNVRRFQVNLNGRLLLTGFDAVAEAGPGAVAVRAFKDISPAEDGLLHLDFLPGPNRPFISAIEVTPGTPGKLKPIRICARTQGFVDQGRTEWSGDKYFVNGRFTSHVGFKTGPTVPELYTYERYGNFSYAIPVPAGAYTVKLHFMETFYGPQAAAAGLCAGPGCRVFDVTCNGVMLLQDFDVFQAASGAFRPMIREFHGLRPNGQGNLLISFSSKVNYAEVRAIEVLDEAK